MKKIILILILLLFACNKSNRIFEYGYIKLIQDCNLRNSYDIKKSKIIGQVYKNETYQIIDIYGDWINVVVLYTIYNNQMVEVEAISGWMWYKLLQEETEIEGWWTIKSSGAYLRELPDKKSKILRILKPNETVQLCNISPTWFKIEGHNKCGWIYNDRKRISRYY